MFIKGPNGKAIPVQQVRTAYVSAPHDETVLEKAHVTNGLGEKYKLFYVSHFETCSNPGRFSGRGGGNRATRALPDSQSGTG